MVTSQKGSRMGRHFNSHSSGVNIPFPLSLSLVSYSLQNKEISVYKFKNGTRVIKLPQWCISSYRFIRYTVLKWMQSNTTELQEILPLWSSYCSVSVEVCFFCLERSRFNSMVILEVFIYISEGARNIRNSSQRKRIQFSSITIYRLQNGCKVESTQL